MKDEAAQKEICAQFGADFLASEPMDKIGIAENVRSGLMPINGLRHPPDSGTTGWFIWSGRTLEDRSDFFLPLHVAHIDEWSKLIRPYLGLAPGWRFLLSSNYADAWFDASLLQTA